MLAELPNSFLKRQLGIGAGQAGRGVFGFVFYVIDQVDMLVGVWLVLSLAIAVRANAAVGVFETTTPVRVKGTVVRFAWANPHSAIIVEQRTEDGETIRWALESSAPIPLLERRGFSKDSFRPGDVIEACGFAPRSAVSSRTEASNQAKTSAGPVWLEVPTGSSLHGCC
jgi:hypothetical protein